MGWSKKVKGNSGRKRPDWLDKENMEPGCCSYLNSILCALTSWHIIYTPTIIFVFIP